VSFIIFVQFLKNFNFPFLRKEMYNKEILWILLNLGTYTNLSVKINVSCTTGICYIFVNQLLFTADILSNVSQQTGLDFGPNI
jgi:hypothetical protein